MSLHAILGGILIGIAGGSLLVFLGRIMGVSGIVGMTVNLLTMHSTREQRQREIPWRVLFIAGMLAGGVFLRVWLPSAAPQTNDAPLPLLVLSGLFVGAGTRMGLGCTSGHGVCGLGRFSGRSLISTGIFMVFGVVAATFLRRIF